MTHTIARHQLLRPIEALINTPNAHKVTSLVSPTGTIVATRRGRFKPGQREENIVLTIGRPNAANRQRIKQCRSAGESFPVRRLHYTYYAGK